MRVLRNDLFLSAHARSWEHEVEFAVGRGVVEFVSDLEVFGDQESDP